MQKISGKEISRELVAQLKRRPVPRKLLAAVLVGEDPASVSFLKQKESVARELGLDFRLYRFPREIKNDELRAKVGQVALSGRVGGVVVQLPLPEGINKYYIVNAIPREKDIDVLGERAVGAFFRGRNTIAPPSVETVKEIVARQSLDLKSACVAVVGLGDLVGKPISTWLLGKCRELVLLDRQSDLSPLTRADLVISGTGRAGLIHEQDLKDGAGLIDFGYARSPEGKLAGDFEAVDDSAKSGFYTPTPGGTGPILVAKLMENFYKLSGNGKR